MANRKKIPYTDAQLRSLRERYTDTDIVERILQETGEVVSPSTISARAVRMGFAKDSRPRRDRTLPWSLTKVQRHSYTAGCLVALGRHLAGEPVAPGQMQKLEGFLRELEAEDRIVGYVMDAPNERDCWIRVPSSYRDHDDLLVPIVRAPFLEADISV